MSSKRKSLLIKSILIDFDGTLVDSEYANFCAYEKAIRELGLQFNSNRLREILIGKHWSHFLPIILEDRYSQSLGELIANRKKDLYPDFYNKITLNFKLIEIVKRYPKMNRGIVSNANRNTIDSILSFFNLKEEFPLIICPNSSLKPKPSPDTYLSAIHKINSPISEVIVVEDSKTGFEAARKAKLNCLYVQEFLDEYF